MSAQTDRAADSIPTWPDAWLWAAARRSRPDTAARAVTLARATAWESLIEAGVAESAVLAWAEAATGVRGADLARVGPAEGELLPVAIARRYGVVPMGRVGASLEVATADPLRAGLDQELSFAAGRDVRLRVASPAQVAAAFAAAYERATPTAPAHVSAHVSAHTGAAQNAATSGTDSATNVLDRIIGEALRSGASDVHIEPRPTDLLVRFRVDGALYDALTVPERLGPAVVSRLKVTAGLDIADRIRPQDGRAAVMHEGRPVDLRISTLPMGSGGEKVVIRLLDSRTAAHDLGALGFGAGELHRLRKLLALSEGMVLVTGPTGSGKTTTLYSALRHVQSSESNIVTVEDPVEYRLAGISQVQVNEKTGLTFASALRSILRQDPDVVLVGEIRDLETASIAIKASMTGHLVLSTLHTNDAPSAVARLLDIGAEAGALSGALKAVVAQRLVRRLCTACSEPVALADLPLDQQALLIGKPTSKLRKSVGCVDCRGTGYRGRMTVAEVMAVTPDMQRAIARGASVSELGDLARQHGMHSLWESGMGRVTAGLTSLHELLDSLTPPAEAEPSAQADIDSVLAALGVAKSVPAPASAPTVAPTAAPTSAAATPATAPARQVSVASTVPGQLSRIGGAVPRPGDGAPRVLVVDDDRAARATLRTALEREGAVVIEAADGESALAYARRLAPDAIVTDLALPRLDGIGLLQAVRADGLPIVCHVATAQLDPALLDWARELGATVDAKTPNARAIVHALRPARQSAA